MKKKPSYKYLREVHKNQKKLDTKAIQNGHKKGLAERTSICSAVKIEGVQNNHSKAIMTRSGAIGMIPEIKLDDEKVKKMMPWYGLEQAIKSHEFVNCAEAHAYLEIKTRCADPKQYRITTYNPENEVIAPCENCSMWVYETFGEVVDN